MTEVKNVYGAIQFSDSMSAEDVESVVRQLYGLVPKWCDGALMLNGTIGHGTNVCASLLEDADAAYSRIAGNSRYAIRYKDVWHYKSQLKVTPSMARVFGIQFSHGMLLHKILYGGELTEFVTARGKYVLARADGMAIKGRELGVLHSDTRHMELLARCSAFDGAISLARRYDWTVQLSVDGSPSISFACTPSAARAAYRLRDLAPGKSRRDALLHWVSAHKRLDDIDVSEHLRGKVEFSWHGIGCKIMPSQFEREKELLRKASGRQPRRR